MMMFLQWTFASSLIVTQTGHDHDEEQAESDARDNFAWFCQLNEGFPSFVSCFTHFLSFCVLLIVNEFLFATRQLLRLSLLFNHNEHDLKRWSSTEVRKIMRQGEDSVILKNIHTNKATKTEMGLNHNHCLFMISSLITLMYSDCSVANNANKGKMETAMDSMSSTDKRPKDGICPQRKWEEIQGRVSWKTYNASSLPLGLTPLSVITRELLVEDTPAAP